MLEGKNRGIVYVLSNPAMDGYIKIGETSGDSVRDVIARMRELDTTGIPEPFQCEYAVVVGNRKEAENTLHIAFGENRVRPTREFFVGIPPFRVKAVLKMIALEDVTPSPTALEDDSITKKRVPAFRFSEAGIPVDSELDWADDSSIKCKIISDRRVEYNDEEYALSKLTAELKGWNVNYAQVGPYWLYQGKTLDEWRELEEDS